MLAFAGRGSQLRGLAVAGAVISCLGLLYALPVQAQTSSAIAQGFRAADSNIVPSTLVGLVSEASNAVRLTSTDTVDSLVGVVSAKPLVELSNGDSEVQVVTSGLAATLVSDMNGPVKTGDKITASPIRGVGMKATESGVIVGTVQSDWAEAQVEERSVGDKSGRERKVGIALLPVQVSVTFYTHTNDTSSFIPPFLQAIANRVTGKDVSPVRVLVAALIFIFLFISVSVLLYSAVRSSITSIGRNPLSEGAVRKSLGQVAATVIGIIVFVVLAIYLVLTL